MDVLQAADGANVTWNWVQISGLPRDTDVLRKLPHNMRFCHLKLKCGQQHGYIYIYTHNFWLAEVKKTIVELQVLTIKKPGKITI